MEKLIRPALPADLPDIDRIQRNSPEAVAWPVGDYLAYDCRVGVLDGHVAGFLVSRLVGPGESEILNLAVDPAFRRLGLARAMLEGALEAAPGDWFLEVRESNAAARRFYSGAGFREVARRARYYQDNGEAAVVMRLQPCYCHR